MFSSLCFCPQHSQRKRGLGICSAHMRAHTFKHNTGIQCIYTHTQTHTTHAYIFIYFILQKVRKPNTGLSSKSTHTHTQTHTYTHTTSSVPQTYNQTHTHTHTHVQIHNADFSFCPTIAARLGSAQQQNSALCSFLPPHLVFA